MATSAQGRFLCHWRKLIRPSRRLVLLGVLLPMLAVAQTLIKRNIPYGKEPAQVFDVHAPLHARGAPVIMLIHGGAWRVGDKDMPYRIDHKLVRWESKGFVVLTVNYRALPKTQPLDQARDIAAALALAQDKAAAWGADRNKFILIGHSAGAHLVALLAARPELLAEQGASPWLGSILLDSSALDIPALMTARHQALEDRAYGSDPVYWQAISPFHQLEHAMSPTLAVCSTQRPGACPEARRFVSKAAGLGTRAALLTQDLSHEEINTMLGRESPYTTAVEAFMRGLDREVAQALN